MPKETKCTFARRGDRGHQEGGPFGCSPRCHPVQQAGEARVGEYRWERSPAITAECIKRLVQT